MHGITIAVDFDGTLIDFVYPIKSSDFKLKPNAKEVINRLHKKGINFILYTARYSLMRWKAIRFIKKEKLPIKTSIFNRKPIADIYIDDKNLYMNKVNWLNIERKIRKVVRKSGKI